GCKSYFKAQGLMPMVFVPVFDGNHYECWSLKMKTFLKTIDLWDVVETGIQKESITHETSSTYHDFDGAADYYSAWWKQLMETKDVNALYLIQTALSHEILPWIASATSSKEAWDILLVRSLGGPKFLERKLIDLEKEYEDMKMKDSETIREFTGKLMDLVFRMKSCGWKVEDKEVVKKILSSLPPRFDQVLVEVAERLSISVLIDCLLVHEYNYMRRMGRTQESLEESFIESVDVEESIQEEAEILYSLNEITQSQVESTERQGEVLSMVQQNQDLLIQIQKQMVALMQHTL
ncbi:hypothetical protein EUTSA_v10015660mg, partial [Eutrema salsugineum]